MLNECRSSFLSTGADDNPRRARRSQPSAAQRESFFAAVWASTPNASTTSLGATKRRPVLRRVASSARPLGLIPAGNDIVRPVIPEW